MVELDQVCFRDTGIELASEIDSVLFVRAP